MKLFIDTAVLILLLAFFTAQLPATITASYMIGIIFLLVKWPKVRFQRTHVNIYIFFNLLLIPPVLFFNHGATPLFYLWMSPFLLFLAYDFSKKPLDHILRVLKNLYWIFVVFIAFALASHWDDPEPLGAILPWASTNGIPSYLIVIQIAYSIAFFLKNNRLPLLSSTATLIVAVFGLGRGSMIVGFLILALSVFINLFVAKAQKDRAVALKAIFFAVIPLCLFFADWVSNIGQAIEIWVEGSKFASGVLDEHRGRILNDYLNKMNEVSLLVGTSYDNTSINDYYGGNPHNSFIRVHSFYGLAAFLILFLPLVFILVSRKDKAQKLTILLLILMALLRAASEPIFFPSALDFFYFLYFALFFRFSRRRLECKAKNTHDF